jgi:hypothetical protein
MNLIIKDIDPVAFKDVKYTFTYTVSGPADASAKEIKGGRRSRRV